MALGSEIEAKSMQPPRKATANSCNIVSPLPVLQRVHKCHVRGDEQDVQPILLRKPPTLLGHEPVSKSPNQHVQQKLQLNHGFVLSVLVEKALLMQQYSALACDRPQSIKVGLSCGASTTRTGVHWPAQACSADGKLEVYVGELLHLHTDQHFRDGDDGALEMELRILFDQKCIDTRQSNHDDGSEKHRHFDLLAFSRIHLDIDPKSAGYCFELKREASCSEPRPRVRAWFMTYDPDTSCKVAEVLLSITLAQTSAGDANGTRSGEREQQKEMQTCTQEQDEEKCDDEENDNILNEDVNDNEDKDDNEKPGDDNNKGEAEDDGEEERNGREGKEIREVMKLEQNLNDQQRRNEQNQRQERKEKDDAKVQTEEEEHDKEAPNRIEQIESRAIEEHIQIPNVGCKLRTSVSNESSVLKNAVRIGLLSWTKN
eukprot:g2426.t1